MTSIPDIRTYKDAEGLARGAASYVIDLASEAIASHGTFSMVLSGGSTPRSLHSVLVENRLRVRLDWSRIHVFWGDERCVPSDHLDSNYRMARETLLDPLALPQRNQHRIHGEMDPRQAAAEYEHTLYKFFSSRSTEGRQGKEAWRFDLVLLGMGDDGHTASLFPGTAAIHEKKRWVTAHYIEKHRAWRVTLTPAIINNAANVAFIVSGSNKAERLKQVLTGPYQPDVLPAQIIQPPDGRLVWMIDAAAAKLL